MNTVINQKHKVVSTAAPESLYSHAKRVLSPLIIILLSVFLSACQVTSAPEKTEIKPKEVNFSHYYLWLKTLDDPALIREEKSQKSLLSKADEPSLDSQSKLILIYSLPFTSLHQPYKAKRLLNEHLLTSNKKSKENVAFTMILRDQLNYQLALLAKSHSDNKAYAEGLTHDKETIKQLEDQLNTLNQQLTLLKQIDKSINARH